MLLKGRTAIVYGASGAVGKAVARAFAREGAKVVMSARRHEPLDRAAEDIGGPSDLVHVMTVDATDPHAIQQHLTDVVQRHGPVSLMFNAVSWDDVQGKVLSEMSFDSFFTPVRLGLTTWFHTGTALAKHMAQNGGGTILGITANAGRHVVAGGLECPTRNLQEEWHAKTSDFHNQVRRRVSAVCSESRTQESHKSGG